MNDDRVISDEALRAALERLGARSTDEGVAVEVVAALADGTYTGRDRIAMLDRVLASARLTQELTFFRAVVAHAPPASPSGSSGAGAAVPSAHAGGTRTERTAGAMRESAIVPRWWRGRPGILAAAAVLLLAVGVARFARPVADDVVRGPEDSLRLLAPPRGAVLSDQTPIIWASSPNAIEYSLEVVDRDGRVVAQARGPDTSFVFRAPLGLPGLTSGRYDVFIVATMSGGSQRRSVGDYLTVP